MHGGVAVASGHGCLNDLWTYNLSTRTWQHLPCSGDRQVISNKVAAHTVAPVAACGHSMAITDDGVCFLYGGLNRNKRVQTMLQALVPLATNIPGGVPRDVAPALFVRTAPVLIGLAHVRCVRCYVVLMCALGRHMTGASLQRSACKEHCRGTPALHGNAASPQQWLGQ